MARRWAHVLLGVTALVVVFPMFWMVSTALKPPHEIFAGTFALWPAQATLANFSTAMAQVPMPRLFWNSLVVACAVTAAQVLTSVLAAYACALLSFRGRDVCFVLFVATMMVPFQVTWRIVVPATRTRLAALCVLFFVNTWNQYLWPLLVASDKLMKTLPVGMQEFVSLEGGTNWGPLMAAATMAIVPALIAYVVAQRYILDSFVAAGLKE